jgi:antitoxin ParD1/3/4
MPRISPASPWKLLAALDASIVRGLADTDTGRTRGATEVFDRLERRYRAMSGET